MIKMKLILDADTYHINDKLSDSVDENGMQLKGTCSGYDAFCRTYPKFRDWLLANPPGEDVSQPQKEFYLRFLGEEGMVFSIEPVEVEKLGAILLAKAETSFQNIALLAQKGMRTNAEEEGLLHLKEAIVCLSQHRDDCVACVPQVRKMTEQTPFGTLRQLPEKVSQYIETVTGKIIGCIPVPHHQDEKLYILVPAVEDASPPLKLGFDGKNFIAVYTENLPKLPEGVMKMLALPAPAQEAKQ